MAEHASLWSNFEKMPRIRHKPGHGANDISRFGFCLAKRDYTYAIKIFRFATCAPIISKSYDPGSVAPFFDVYYLATRDCHLH